MCVLFRPFNKITNLISDACYPISNTYCMQVWKIECLSTETLKGDDLLMKYMAKRMMEEFGKYGSKYSVILAL